MTLSLDLTSAHAKLDRAREHLRILDAETAAFYEGSPSEGQPYEIHSEFRPDSSEYVFVVKVLRPPPVLLSLLLGDFAHNLRASLDHLVYGLARLTGSSGATTQYPVCSTDVDYMRKEPTWLDGVVSEHRTLIQSTQPYHLGHRADEHFLSIIQWLDNTDKHRTLHRPFGFFTDPGLSGARQLQFVANKDAGTIRYPMVANGRRIEGDTDIVRLKLAPLGPNPKVDMQGDLTFEPAFGDRWLAGGVLPELASGVEKILDFFG